MTIKQTITTTKTFTFDNDHPFYLQPSNNLKIYLKDACARFNRGVVPQIKAHYNFKDILNNYGLVPVYCDDSICYIKLNNNHPIFDSVNVTQFIKSIQPDLYTADDHSLFDRDSGSYTYHTVKAVDFFADDDEDDINW